MTNWTPSSVYRRACNLVKIIQMTKKPNSKKISNMIWLINWKFVREKKKRRYLSSTWIRSILCFSTPFFWGALIIAVIIRVLLRFVGAIEPLDIVSQIIVATHTLHNCQCFEIKSNAPLWLWLFGDKRVHVPHHV